METSLLSNKTIAKEDDLTLKNRHFYKKLANDMSLVKFAKAVGSGEYHIQPDPELDGDQLYAIEEALEGIIPQEYTVPLLEAIKLPENTIYQISCTRHAIENFCKLQRNYEREQDWQDNGPWPEPLLLEQLADASQGIFNVYGDNVVLGTVSHNGNHNILVDVIHGYTFRAPENAQVGDHVLLSNRISNREATDGEIKGGYDSVPDGKFYLSSKKINQSVWKNYIEPCLGKDFVNAITELYNENNSHNTVRKISYKNIEMVLSNFEKKIKDTVRRYQHIR